MDKKTIRLVSTGFILLISMMILVQLKAVRTLDLIAESTNNLYRHPFTVSKAVLKIDADIIAMHRHMKDVVLAQNDHELDLAISLVNQYETQAYNHFDLIMTRFLGDKATIKRTRLLFSNWKPIRSEVIELVRQRKNIEAATITKGKGAVYVESLTQEMDALIQFAQNKANGFVAASNEQHQKSRLISYFLMSLTIVIGLVIAYLITKKATKNSITLNEIENRWQLALKVGHDSIWEWNIQTGDFYWSERIAPLFGYPSENLEPTYENFVAAIHPDDRTMVISAVNDCIENGTDYKIEHRVLWPDGQIRWVQETGDVIRDDNGTALRMLGVIQDIHPRKLAEESLIESEEKYRRLFELSEDPMWLIINDKFELANKAAAQILGYSSVNDLTNTHPSLLSPDYQPDGEPSFFKANKMMSIAYQHGYHRFEWLHNKTNGAGLAVDISLTRIPYKGKKALFCIWRDISERNKIQEQLIQAKETAEQANLAKSDFLSSMSHELRTPMNAILGFSQLMEFDESLNDENKENVHEILKAGNHLLALINEVLDLSKIESGGLDLKLEPVEISTVIEECLNLVRPLAEQYLIQINDYELNNLTVFVDRTRLKQVVINLLSNAIKYNTPKGSISISVDKTKHGTLKLQITDTGNGLSDEQISKIFHPFERLNAKNSTIEGTGIGLTICKRIIEEMNGSIDVSSTLGEGSCFWVELNLFKP